ncbi:putative uncharacterized protein [Mycobacterium sp. PO1]|nr:putative uncharacterized protein [Mycobacterium sp. PO1]GFM22982.1 putative uncharacterized protein [Mycobacterium sp. PO2]
MGVREYGDCAVYGLFMQLSQSSRACAGADAIEAQVTDEADAPRARSRSGLGSIAPVSRRSQQCSLTAKVPARRAPPGVD